MKLASPRLVVVDDILEHLRGLSDSLSRDGAACLQIHFTGELTGIGPCGQARVIFTDLHLIESGGTAAGPKDFALIGGLIDTLKPAGPYLLVLWTNHAEYAVELRDYLKENLTGVAKPFSVVALDKMAHVNEKGEVRNEAALIQAVSDILQAEPQISALLNWEEHVLLAAADTVSSLMMSAQADGADPATGLRRFLARLGAEAVGIEHLDGNRFGAVNEGLLPILADRIGAITSEHVNEAAWKGAFDANDAATTFSVTEAAHLYKTVHIAEDGSKGWQRGAVVLISALPRLRPFVEQFGVTEDAAAQADFGCTNFKPDDDTFRWCLVQVQPVCDFAQRKSGPLPFLLALEMPNSSLKSGSLPGALWTTRPFYIRDQARVLAVNFRFQAALPPDDCNVASVYRLRDQLLTSLAYDAHAHGARPGTLNLREITAREAAKSLEQIQKK